MTFFREAAAAVGCLTVLGRAAAGASRATLAGGLAFYPVVGLALGALVGALGAGLAGLGSPAVGVGTVLALVALTGGRGVWGLAAAAEAFLGRGGQAAALARLRARPGLLGWAVAAALLGAKIAAVAVLPPSARLIALAVAPMLGAWAIVVQCYGGSPAHARGPAAALVGRARFREFGWASLTALGVTLGLGEAIGLVVVLVASLTTVGLRLYAYRRLGGLTGRLLAATRELVETLVLATLGLLACLRG